MYQYCGFLTLAHLFRNRLEMNERYVLEFQDQAKAAILGKDVLPASAARIALESFRNNYGDGESV